MCKYKEKDPPRVEKNIIYSANAKEPIVEYYIFGGNPLSDLQAISFKELKELHELIGRFISDEERRLKLEKEYE